MRHLAKIFFIFHFSFFILQSAFAQVSTDEKLANQYFQNKEYDKAIVYYEKLFGKKSSELIYQNYLSCLLAVKDFKTAEKVVKKQMKNNPGQLDYGVDLGMVYFTAGDPDKARSEYEKVIKQLPADQEPVFNLANAFLKIKEWDYAIATYQKGRKLLRGVYPFNMELAEVYQQKGDVTAMISEYLDMLELGDSYLQSVQNSLQADFGSEGDAKKNEIIRSQLLKRVQQSPDKTVYTELLVWMLMQQKEFDSAFTQIKALDKRKKEDGSRVIALAQTCVQNENYDVAVKAYKYIIDKGPESSYYLSARIELLNAMYKKVVSRNNYTQTELIELEANYSKSLSELGKSVSTVSLIKDMAHLQAFYLYKTKEAIALLEEAVQMPLLSATLQAECKLELADILLMTGDVWEASLTYSQVEKAFKYDVVGQEAKFRNARIAFYTADFKWAQAQLDVLKGSTSKLIANDAMALSIMISDNMGWDSITTPLEMYARADLLSFQNRDDEALIVLDSIKEKYPSHTIQDDILFKRYAIMMKKNKYEEAAKYLQNIIDNFSWDILGDDAMYYLAGLYENRLNDKQKAMGLYNDLLVKFPGSMFTVESRKRFRKLRGDAVN
ncbi:MAG: tetratricopeptide repeat protein [Bacteroidetes bacterium]|nr:tetratricopeptide repeat protein [Bacteroidota bacterium]